MPAASSPGTSTSSSVAPAIPDASISRNAAARGEPNSALTAAKLPAAATGARVCGGPARGPPADGDQRRLGPEDHPERQRGQGRDDAPGQLDRLRSAARLEPLG